MVIKSIKAFWRRNSLTFIFLFFLISIILGWISNRNSIGTWDKYYYYSKTMFDPLPSSSKSHKPPSPFSSSSSFKEPPKDSKLEIACRQALVRMFGKPFDKIRPDWLRNVVTGGKWNLEIDCYNDELKIGVEAQGRQHYEYVPYFHRNYDTFMNQKYRDEIKRMKCKEQGVTLVEVPYTVKPQDVEDYLRKEFIKLGVKVPN